MLKLHFKTSPKVSTQARILTGIPEKKQHLETVREQWEHLITLTASDASKVIPLWPAVCVKCLLQYLDESVVSWYVMDSWVDTSPLHVETISIWL